MIRRVALIGNHPPRLCGIASFTADVAAAIETAFPDTEVDVYAMDEPGAAHLYPPQVVCGIGQDDLADYQTAARRINESAADVICVQHEYGIFGGPAGSHLLKLLDGVNAPVVVTLHTLLESPNADQRAVIDGLVRRAAQLIVMAERGREMLERVHGVARERIKVIPHGVPDRPLVDPDAVKARFGFEGREVLLTFGLLSPNKGIETMIRALPLIKAARADVLYVVLGATHPQLAAREGEAYRQSLEALAEELGVSQHVRFLDVFLDQHHLLDYIEAADIYVTPYLHEQQITSGTLSYAVGLGKAVVSTPYWHAAELLADGVGVLCPFDNSDAFARAIVDLLDDRGRLEAMRARAWRIGRGMTWKRLGERYVEAFHEARQERPLRLVRSTPPGRRLVPPKLDVVERLTDSCGMLQHSIFSVPDRDHGYCVDDNARALMLMHLIEGTERPRADRLTMIYAAFVQFAWNGAAGRFRNFMSYDREWLEAVGSEDSCGRSLWAIGATAVGARERELRQWALHLFDQVAPHARELQSLRAWAFSIFGLDAVLDLHPGHGSAKTTLAALADALHGHLVETRREGWCWFEPTLGYDNARLPEALIRAGRQLGNDAMVADALAALSWLDAIQTNDRGQFRAVGTESFGRAFRQPLTFDQQPLEAWATIEAAAVAHAVTGEVRWLDSAWRAYHWYFGANDTALPLAAPANGGCFDGLMSDRVNLNQGAESVLAFQFACAAMAKLMRQTEDGTDEAGAIAS